MTAATWSHSTMPAEARLMEACGVDPRDVLAEPLTIRGQRVTYREIWRDADGRARIDRRRAAVVTRRTPTIWAPADALARYRQEKTP